MTDRAALEAALLSQLMNGPAYDERRSWQQSIPMHRFPQADELQGPDPFGGMPRNSVHPDGLMFDQDLPPWHPLMRRGV